jgi:Fur family transcriptional regulator, ferric uptake regulator
MTTSPPRPPLHFDSIEEVIALLRGKGQRLSANRRLVLEALFDADGPVSAEHIAGGLGGRRVTADVTSVYRTLEQFEELGVIHHVHIGHGPGLYALVGSGEPAYLACESCHRVDVVDLDPIRDQINDRFGYEARLSHFAIVGLCPDCAAGGSTRRRSHRHSHSHGDFIHSHAHAAHQPGTAHRH